MITESQLREFAASPLWQAMRSEFESRRQMAERRLLTCAYQVTLEQFDKLVEARTTVRALDLLLQGPEIVLQSVQDEPAPEESGSGD